MALTAINAFSKALKTILDVSVVRTTFGCHIVCGGPRIYVLDKRRLREKKFDTADLERPLTARSLHKVTLG